MICQKCKKAAATLCISQVVNNQKLDIYLCQNCANESAAAGLKAAVGLMGQFPGPFIFGLGHDPYFKIKSDARCDVCGKTFSEIRQDGKIGCAHCYEVFQDKLRPIIERIHKSAVHKGSCPANISEAYKTARRLDTLKAALAEAVRNEEYEKAAGIRDDIKSLEVGQA
jgi:protein arginine kinase activator